WADRRAVRAPGPSVHRGPDAGDGATRPEGYSARADPRRASESRCAPRGLCVRRPLPPRARRVPDHAAPALSGARRPRRALPPRARAVRSVAHTEGGLRGLTVVRRRAYEP